ncbi:iron complex transport system substrate-binding protein [Abditibacterium utsteinense]|uniref:Iron complex transport system substrate-binding protein n=1 Tax=Abditibacterium utsteinense TaxID=1960156 RepID=A0A2S8SU35_9BACT|nr:cobalamin-binding protein [Abditibacterium utsteinense]PQV64290.1 iron complex transport system substrate-binding protein [Abditibacterium utsteinense]
MRIVSLLPAATEIVGALGLMDSLLGVSHECDFPDQANHRPRVTFCALHEEQQRRLVSSQEVDRWVRETLASTGTLYQLDEELMRELRPDLILTQKLCDVCAVGYGSVAKMAAQLPGPPRVVNLEPSCLEDVFANIRAVAVVTGVAARGETVVAGLRARVEAVRLRAQSAASRPRCYLMEWVDPPYCAGHWNPELVQLAGGEEVFGRVGGRSTPVAWDEVLRAQPEVLVLALCGWSVERARQELPVLQSYPGWDELPAVRRGQVYAVDGSAYFSRPGPRLVESLETLAGIFHPELFAEFAPQNKPNEHVAQFQMPVAA